MRAPTEARQVRRWPAVRRVASVGTTGGPGRAGRQAGIPRRGWFFQPARSPRENFHPALLLSRARAIALQPVLSLADTFVTMPTRPSARKKLALRTKLDLLVSGLAAGGLSQDGKVEPPFDIRAIISACVERFTSGLAVQSATDAESDRLVSALYGGGVNPVTGAFDPDRYVPLRDAILALPRPQVSWDDEMRTPQVQKNLRSLKSGMLVAGAVTAIAILDAPTHFAPDTFRGLTTRQKQSLSELLFWSKVVFTDDRARLRWWHLSLAVADVCVAEMRRRFDEHEVTRKVHDALERADPQAYDWLGRLMHRWTHGLFLKNDNAADVTQQLLNDQLTSINRKWKDDPLLVAVQVLDGKYDLLPRRIRDRFKNEIRNEQRRLKRTGPPWTRAAARQLSISLGTQTFSEASRPAESASIWKDWADVQELLRAAQDAAHFPIAEGELSATLDKLSPLIGRALPLIRLYVTAPEAKDWTDKNLASHLQRSEKTIREWRDRLEGLWSRVPTA